MLTFRFFHGGKTHQTPPVRKTKDGEEIVQQHNKAGHEDKV